MDFDIRWDLASYTVRQGVVMPLCGRGKDKATWMVKFSNLYGWWRTKVFNLKDKLNILKNKPNNMYACQNCMLSGVNTKVLRRCCRANICPWCYGRYLQDLYRKFNNIIKNINNPEEFKLISFVRQIKLPYKNSLKERIVSEVNRRRKLLRNRKTILIAGHYAVSIEPLRKARLIKRRLLTIVPVNFNKYKEYKNVQYKEYPLPLSKQIDLARAIAQTFSYPAKLMTYPEPKRTANILNVRHKHRLAASFGLMRTLPELIKN